MKPTQTSSPKPLSKRADRHEKAVIPSALRSPSQDFRERILDCYVNGNVLDISQASTFYQKEAAVVEVLTNYVEKLPGSRYKLKNGFDTFFHGSLPVFLAGHPAQPADALADSLFRIAQHWAHARYIDSLPGDRNSVSTAVLDNEWKESWKRMSETAWEGFQEMNRPLATYIITALDEKGNVNDDLTLMQTVRHVGLGISFAQDVHQAPEMRILIKGDPAVSFMLAFMRKSLRQKGPRDDKQELQNLRVILDSAVSKIAKEFLGLTRETKGRPRDIGERAAYLLYHRGKPIRLVARELCALRSDSKHNCDPKCSDKIKKAAANHFKYLRQEIMSLEKSTQERIPPILS